MTISALVCTMATRHVHSLRLSLALHQEPPPLVWFQTFTLVCDACQDAIAPDEPAFTWHDGRGHGFAQHVRCVVPCDQCGRRDCACERDES